MSATPYFKLYFSDLAGDTLHLSDAEMGSYVLLLGALWNAGGSLRLDAVSLARIARVSPAKWAARWVRLKPFFIIKNNRVTHRRLTAERNRVAEISQTNSENGTKGAAAKRRKSLDVDEANASKNGKRNRSHTKHHIQIYPPSPPEGGLEPSAFDQAWQAFPDSGKVATSRDRSSAAWAPAAAEVGDARLLAAVLAFAASPHAKGPGAKPVVRMHLWLSGRRWEMWLRPEPAALAWPGPAEVRAAVLAACGADLVANYLDQSGWQDLPFRAVLAKHDFAADQLRDAGALDVLAQHDVAILVAEPGRAA